MLPLYNMVMQSDSLSCSFVTISMGALNLHIWGMMLEIHGIILLVPDECSDGVKQFLANSKGNMRLCRAVTRNSGAWSMDIMTSHDILMTLLGSPWNMRC